MPLAPTDGLLIRALPSAKPLRVDVKQPRRSVQFNRLYWSLLSLVCDNLDQDFPPEALHDWLKIRLGYTYSIKLKNGDIAQVARSIAFDKMEAADFKLYFDAVVNLIVLHILPGVNKTALTREAEAMLGIGVSA